MAKKNKSVSKSVLSKVKTSKSQTKLARARSAKTQAKSNNISNSYTIPKYILDENRKETEIITIQTKMNIARLCRPYTVNRKNYSFFQPNWQADKLGTACFKKAVKDILVKANYEYEDLKALSTIKIVCLMEEELNKTDSEAHKKYKTQWQTEFREAYNTGKEHKEYWQKRAREIIASVKQWSDNLITGEIASRVPLPYMDISSRPPDLEDLAWMYLVLGKKLEEIFGIKFVFIPEDVEVEIVNLWRHLEKPFWWTVHGASELEEFKTYWNHIKEDIQDWDKANRSDSDMSRPLFPKKWASIFSVSTSTIRRWEKENKYPFKKISKRKWALPIRSLPAEYLQKYKEIIES